VQSAVRKWFQKQNTNFLKDGFQTLVQRWQKCIEVRDDFVEKLLCIFENIGCRHISFISLIYLFPFIFYLSGGKTYQPALVTQYIYFLA
jgi:hypothetical protein